MTTINDIRNATLSARARTKDKMISTRAKSGLLQIVSIRMLAGVGVYVTPLSDYLSADEAVTALNELKSVAK